MPDSRHDKIKRWAALSLTHLLLFPVAVLFWGMGYLSLAYHRSQGVIYEITALLAPSYWHSQNSRSPDGLFPLRVDTLYIPSANNSATEGDAIKGRDHLLIFWQRPLEENLRILQPLEAVNSLVWVEGTARSGNEVLTRIACAAVDLQGIWQVEPFGGASFRGVGRFSQQIYNLGSLWLVFYSFRNALGDNILPQFDIMHRARPHAASLWRLGSLRRTSWGWEGERLTSTDIVQRIRLYQPGVIPIGFRLGMLRTAPEEGEVFWPLLPFPEPRGGSGIWEYSWIVLFPLRVVATPYRYLFYLPLVLAPRILVWPVAVLWTLLLLGSWVWCFLQARRHSLCGRD